MSDLFNYDKPRRYPDAPGAAKRDTSIAAADDIAPRQGTLQALVLEALRLRPMASFELAMTLGRSYRSVQPRTAELAQRTDKRPALIRDSGGRKNDPETGRAAIVWELIARED